MMQNHDHEDQQFLSKAEIAFNNFKSIRDEEALDPDHLKQFKNEAIKPLYPMIYDEEVQEHRKYHCCEACCGQSSGTFICGEKAPDPSFIKAGLASCMYFNFLKSSSIFYMFVSVLALLACGICIAVSVQNGFDPLSDYKTLLFSTTYGSFSSESNKCTYGKIDSITNTVTVQLSCPYGSLKRFGTVFSTESLNSLQNCRTEQRKLQAGQDSTSGYLLSQVSSCDSAGNTCDQTLVFNSSQTSSLVSYTYECYDNVYYFGAVSLHSKHFLYAVVIIDLVFCLGYIVFLLVENVSEKRQQNFFNMNQLSLKDYSVEVVGINRRTADRQLVQLVNQLNTKMEQTVDQTLFAFTLPECEEMITNYFKQKNAYENIFELINEFYFSNGEIQNFQHSHEQMLHDIKPKEYEKLKKQFDEEINIFLANKRRQIYKASTQQLPLFLVFNKISTKKKVMELQEKNCCSNNFKIDGIEYKFLQPEVPDMIMWENRTCWTKLRMTISWLITLIICLGSFMLFGYLQYLQNQLFEKYNYGIDCNVLFTSAQLTIIDASLSSNADYTTCICKSESLVSLVSGDSSYCTQWQKEYITYLAVPLCISLGIVVYNVCISFFYRIITRFEKHKLVVSQDISYTIKRAFLLILNMGVIMILLNINFNGQIFTYQNISLFFTGKYDDFTSDWYSNIGSLIILTMIFNIAFPIIELALASFLKLAKKCWDTRCLCRSTSCSTKEQYIGLYNDDIYPVGQRYAYLIATFMVTVAFCGVIPALAPIAFISFFLLFFVDKLLMFKFYQIPKNYTTTLHKMLGKVLLFAIIIHCVLTAFLLTEPTLIGTQTDTISSLFTTGSSRLNTMFTTPYVIPYILIFFALVIFVIIKAFVVDVFKKCYEVCFRPFAEGNEKFMEIELASLLDKRQSELLIRMCKLNLVAINLKRSESSIVQTMRAAGGTERELIDSVVLQEDITNRTIQILTRRIKQIGGRGKFKVERSDITLLGVPSYEHLITGNNLKRFDQMLELERQFKENKRKGKKSIGQKKNKYPLNPTDKKNSKDGNKKGSDSSEKPQAPNNSTGFSFKAADESSEIINQADIQIVIPSKKRVSQQPAKEVKKVDEDNPSKYPESNPSKSTEKKSDH